MEPLLRATDIAKRLNISRSQAFALMRSGDIRTFRFGRSVRVRSEDLEAFIEANLSEKTKNLPVGQTTSKSILETPSSKGDHHV